MRKILKLSTLISLLVLIISTSCVKNEVTGITLNKSTSNLIIGQTDSLTADIATTGDVKNTEQNWTSSNSTVASVENGIVTALRSGTSTITVKVGAKSASCEVTVVDKIYPLLTQGELWYFGNVYMTKDSLDTKGSNNFVVYLASAGINMESPDNAGELLIIELNTPLTVKDSIPVGIYEMSTETHFNKLTPNTLVPAFIEAQSGNPWGCWYFGVITDPISMGNIVVSRVNNLYTINYELFDSYGVEVKGSFHGALNYYDGTIQTAQTSINNLMKLKPGGINHKSLKFQKR